MRKLRTGKTVTITEDRIIRKILNFLYECDCDELATLAGNVLGGECVYKTEEEYEFTPNEDYAGALDG